ncbi:MAG: prepilin-type N-terminal cleavage/methylation domain-containing protein [Planctomycetes bacterium]|nr:prepilin-type N-terminal cleavage/methylation domain-containing protein [Planctomycetota bacterium]
MRRRAQGFTLIEIMVVIAIIAGLIGTVAIIVPQMQEKQKRLTCVNNLSQLGQTFVVERTEKAGKPKYSGQSLWLSWRVKGSKIREGEEGILVCPGDNGITAPATPEDRKKYNDIDLGSPPSDMCSYASRDFGTYPLSNESKSIQLIGCDRNGPDGKTAHHKDGLNIVFDNGSAEFYDREKLGVSPTDPIVVGPESPNETLKQAIYTKQKQD